ncbi:asparagine synthase (glutamine-hydrolyzing) [Pseudoalteromonas phenolica O-BC30]|nr:asparagine synthase (glutamine-hydrolyzing) [Pseudoalteromonas phenolica O-BC30]
MNFGHVRLAIVELSELGHQPMIVNGNAITFNGEVYNYVELREELIASGAVFKSSSDTEVILQGYNIFGTQFFEKLNGAYAFAIFDSQKDEIIFCRDRAGEKPLFYSPNESGFYFSSELRGLMNLSSLPKKLEHKALYNYFVHGYVDGENSWFEGVASLKPGHFMTVKLGSELSYETQCYWKVPNLTNPSDDLDYLKNKLSSLISSSISLQLRCDVPASILLSGGVDSSMLTAFASQHTKRVKTFTVKFPGHPKFDESKSARLIADHYSTDHTEIEGVDISTDLFMKIAKNLDTPINDSSLLPTFLVNEAVSHHCKVALGGDGGDELFGGYKHYHRMQKMLQIKNRSLGLLKLPARVVRKNLSLNSKYRNWLKALESDLSNQMVNIRSFYDERHLQLLIPSLSDSYFDADVWGSFESEKAQSVLELASKSDFNHYLRDSILVKSDRCSMLNSIEARAPLLDYRIIDFAFSEVPDNYKINNGMKKFILKEVSKDILPSTFDFDRKLGFNLPLGDMIRTGAWKDMFGDILNSDSSLIDKKFSMSLFDKHLSGEVHTDRLFGLVLFLVWAEENQVQNV